MRPLEGLLVVAVEQAVAAPFCTARLAEAGARVIKIEREGGDFARGYDRAAAGDASYFVWINQGKESVTCDFRSAAGRALLSALVARADVFVQNRAPGAMARAGFGSDDLRARYPRLITCDISGYGESPELAAKKAYDFLVQCESGLVSISGGPGELGRVGVSVADIGAGMTAHAGVLEALIRRGVTGKGGGVAVSLFDVLADWMTVPLVHAETGAGAPARAGLRHPSIAPYGAFRTRDDGLTVISVQNEREWARLCDRVLEAPGLATDPRFDSNNARVANRAALEAEMAALVGRFDAAGFRARLSAAGIAFGALNGMDELSDHPALRRIELVNSQGAALRLPAPPIRHAGAAPGNRRVPAPGEHTAAVTAEFLGGDTP